MSGEVQQQQHSNFKDLLGEARGQKCKLMIPENAA